MDKQKMRGAKNSQEAENWANEKEEESLARILQNSGLSTPIQLKCPADFCSYLCPSTALPVDSTSHPMQHVNNSLRENKT